MDYKEALAYLDDIRDMGTKLSLENIQKLIDNLPFDLSNIKFIQVAGTNGKGSTSHFLTSILMNGGKKVGMFISPHLQDIRERITINKEWISTEDFSECLGRIKDISIDLLDKKIIDNIPTFFEHMLLAALYYFYKENVDAAVMEVGLGGRLDATTTLSPEVSVITNISHDHTKTLGRRISDIAAEKAGIIKRKVPVVCGCNVRSISNRVIREKAVQMEAPFFNVLDRENRLEVQKHNGSYSCSYQTGIDHYLFDVRLNGNHQTMNAATAVKAIQVLNNKNGHFRISHEAIARGIAENIVPGRIEKIDTSPRIILDASHNEASIRALKNYLDQEEKKTYTLVFGVLRDKKYRKIAEMLEPFAGDVILTEPISKRALPAEKLVQFFNKKNVIIKKTPGEALHAARQIGRDILITGSFYLAGEIRNIIQGG